MKTTKNQTLRLARKARIRKKISGTAQRPRLTIFRSNRNIIAQLIDDTTGKTVAYVSTLDKELRKDLKGKNLDTAKKIGALMAERASAKGIASAVFDRNGYRYHGVIKAFAEAVREKGIKF